MLLRVLVTKAEVTALGVASGLTAWVLVVELAVSVFELSMAVKLKSVVARILLPSLFILLVRYR